jgi:hypothetical protein
MQAIIRQKHRLAIIIPILLIVIVFGWLAGQQRQKYRNLYYVIPPGTYQSIQAGRPKIEIPDEIELTLGLQDTIIIENQDDVVHTFGPFVIAPHSTVTKRFDKPVVYEGACTFHQEQQMRLVVHAAPWDIFR